MVTLAQVNYFILTDTFNMCHPSYESMSFQVSKTTVQRIWPCRSKPKKTTFHMNWLRSEN